ncbi:MAG: hypothetical protein HZB98_13590 [Bacteroidia bacterium]|nr:hypothetical protein [Bacteroidia bacterium]
MKRFLFQGLIHLIVLIFFSSEIHAVTDCCNIISQEDTIRGDQLLYNGRLWRDLYVAIKGDQFLYSNEFQPGNVKMNDRLFNNLKLRYDILNDEIITITEKGLVIQLNKEMVEGFTITNKLRDYNFRHLFSDSLNTLNGYFYVMYEGKSSLFVKYYKEISKRGPGKNYEDFVQSDRIYIIKDKILYHIRNKRDFNKVVSDKKHEIKVYVNGIGLKINRKDPDSFAWVLRYYDSLR